MPGVKVNLILYPQKIILDLIDDFKGCNAYLQHRNHFLGLYRKKRKHVRFIPCHILVGLNLIP